MKVVLLAAIIFAVALDLGGQGKSSYIFRLYNYIVGVQASLPCQQTSSNNAYDTFVHRHILNDNNLDRNSEASWERYLVRKRLCGRVPVQSFIDTSAGQVQQICQKGGWRVENGGNLCISVSSMTVYDVESEEQNGQCTVTKLSHRQQKVVVACNKVVNVCRPVHYQKYNNQQPTNVPCIGATDL